MDSAVDGVVVPVGGRRWGAGVALGGSVVLGVGVVDQGDVRLGVFYSKLGVGHEVVDGAPRLGFLQPLVQGATKRIHHSDLPGPREETHNGERDKEKNTRGEVRRLEVEARSGG